MKEDFSELVQYLDGKFTRIDERFEGIGEELKAINRQLANKADKEDLLDKADKIDVDNILTAIDGYAKKAETFFEEMVALSHKVDRHEKWLLQLADKLGVKLQY